MASDPGFPSRQALETRAGGMGGVRLRAARLSISLATYDGGLPDHLLLVEPLLRTLGLPVTFYLSATFFLENPRAWAAPPPPLSNHSLRASSDPC